MRGGRCVVVSVVARFAALPFKELQEGEAR